MRRFVIEFHRKTGARRVTEFDSIQQAISYRIERERLRERGDIEVVALSSKSLESLMRTHSRYFAGKDQSTLQK